MFRLICPFFFNNQNHGGNHTFHYSKEACYESFFSALNLLLIGKMSIW